MHESYKELLTIGITAFNEGRFLKETIESCIDQAGCVIVCDNASTDNSEEICRDLEKKYSNLVYIRLEKDRGKGFGYYLPLQETKTKYFMWLGAHDLLDKNYTAPMIHMMEHSDAVGCYPSSRSIDINGNEIGIYDCWFANRLSSDSAIERIYALIAHLHEVSAFYGVFHTAILKKYLPHRGFLDIVHGDHVLLCALASEGRLIHSPRAMFNWRQTKAHLTDAENIKITQESLAKPDSSNEVKKISASRKEMREGQLEILKQCKAKNLRDFFKKIRLVRKAKKKLQKRFG